MPPLLEHRVLLVGAGGHARVCLDALADDPVHQVVGAVSRDGTGVDGLDVPVVGVDTELAGCAARLGATHAFVAVGDNAARARLAHECAAAGLELVVAVSHAAVRSPSAELRPGVALLPGAVVNAATMLGRGTIVNTNASVDHDCLVGDWVHVAPGVAVGGGVTIGDGTLVGIGATVLPGVRIGAHAVVGAGAVVVRDVPDGVTVVGVPARPVGPPVRSHA